MLIENVRVTVVAGDRLELSAICGGRPLYYRVPQSRFRRSAVGDVLVLATLVPAMRSRSTIRLPPDLSVSSHLASNLPKIQRIFASWNPRLQQVSLDAPLYEAQRADRGVGLFYAGGVDSSYSLITHLDEVESLVLAFGFDFGLSEEEIRESTLRNRTFAERLGKEFIPVETNHSQFVASLGVSRGFLHGASLSCMALLLGLRTCYIASSHSIAYMRPDGSHPILDPLFSNGTTEIVHDDASVSRLEKTWTVAKHRDVLDNLRVCWESHNENCGDCSKCLRTMTALRLCGVLGPFPRLRTKDIRRVGATAEVEYVVGMILAAREKGDKEVLRELKRGLREHDFKEVIRYLDQVLLSGRLRKWYSRRKSITESELIKVDLRPDLDIP
jgi:hypothetical protein